MLKIIVMSDIHPLAPGEIKFGLDTAERLGKAISDVKEFYGDADLCVYAGDIADAGRVEAYQQFEDIRRANPIESRVMLGNHDDRPTYLRNAVDPMVDADGFVQGSLDIKGYRIIMIDSSEPGHTEGVLCEKRLTWLATQLSDAKTADLPVILIIHHNANQLHMPVDTYSLDQPEKLATVLKHSGAQISQIIAGHCHITTAGSWYGFPVATISGNHHRVAGFFRNMTGQQLCYEGPAHFAVLFADKNSVTLHFHSYIDRNVQLPNAMFPWKFNQKFAEE